MPSEARRASMWCASRSEHVPNMSRTFHTALPHMVKEHGPSSVKGTTADHNGTATTAMPDASPWLLRRLCLVLQTYGSVSSSPLQATTISYIWARSQYSWCPRDTPSRGPKRRHCIYRLVRRGMCLNTPLQKQHAASLSAGRSECTTRDVPPKANGDSRRTHGGHTAD